MKKLLDIWKRIRKPSTRPSEPHRDKSKYSRRVKQERDCESSCQVSSYLQYFLGAGCIMGHSRARQVPSNINPVTERKFHFEVN